MNRKLKAALAGLAFVAGCEIGIALQLVKMIHNYTIKEAAGKESIDEAESKAATEPAAADPEKAEDTDAADAVETETADVAAESEDAAADPSADAGNAQAAFAD